VKVSVLVLIKTVVSHIKLIISSIFLGGDIKGEETITVNEDLFQNLDGLDLSGDEDLLDSD